MKADEWREEIVDAVKAAEKSGNLDPLNRICEKLESYDEITGNEPDKPF